MSRNRMPAAEVDVVPDLVRRLVASQHPDLARLPIEMLASGWDNVIFRLGDDLLVRMPRRELAFLANSADNEEIAGIGRRTLSAVLM